MLPSFAKEGLAVDAVERVGKVQFEQHLVVGSTISDCPLTKHMDGYFSAQLPATADL